MQNFRRYDIRFQTNRKHRFKVLHRKFNLAVLHVIHEHADILNLEAVVQMFICITKM